MHQDSVATFGNVPQRRSHTKTRYVTDLNTQILLENRTLCPSDSQLSVLFMVHSALTNWKRRDTMRTILALGNSSLYTNYSIRVLFLLGRTKYAHVMEMTVIRQEFDKYGDILQGNFLDSYRNLTYKGSMGMKWVSLHCANVKYVIKLDDDVYVDLYNVFHRIYHDYSSYTRLVMCNKMPANSVSIDRRGHWTIDQNVFRHYGSYPWSFCSGFAVVLSGAMMPILHKAAQMVPFFWVDDAFLYGILRSGVDHHSEEFAKFNYSQLHKTKFVQCFNQSSCDYVFGLAARSVSETLHYLRFMNLNFGTSLKLTPDLVRHVELLNLFKRF
ncbi:beta-1,3-galactosyltransferase 1-like [Haliotis rufescens]|uniref:beta-1,3-galactosyltransferase 1-like n=1 Tax=Haliotis rufescens TaxID=6454 RepID=UPI00201F2A8E|nr:beta-1,3-galactosyltransferase 1-like [Haliotis rufescens]